MKKRTLVLALVLGSSLFAADISIGIRIGTPPPPPRIVRYTPPAPGPDFVWISGYWDVSGSRYAWHEGYWERPPYADGFWIAPRWESGQYFQGHWDRRGKPEKFKHDKGRHKGWDRDHERD
jgi:YXWGXW repeat-containing protein